MDKRAVDSLITNMLATAERVSDLLFLADKTPLVESDGHLIPYSDGTSKPILTADFIDGLADYIIGEDERLRSEYAETGACDCSYAIENVARFRVNIYKENRRRAIVMRKLQSTVPSLSALDLPKVFQEIVKEKNGIVLVTGAAGSGKSTTLAAMVNQLNCTQAIHIVTLEDPVEYLHPSGLAAISHRELGRDFRSFADGLRAALRQAPKVILVGEIRDRETMEIALTAAETGHLVFSTLHTINAGQTINRIIGLFTRDEEEQLRYRLSDTVRYVVSQRLVPRVNGARFLITEVLGSSLRTRESIRYGETEGRTFHEIIEAATTFDWHSFDHCLLKAFEAQEITEETALLYCNDRGRVRRTLDLLKKRLSGFEQQPQSPTLKLEVPDPALTASDSPHGNQGEGESALAGSAATRASTHRRVIQPRTTSNASSSVARS